MGCVCIYIYVCIYICVWVWVYVCMYVCIYIYICVCVYMYVSLSALINKYKIYRYIDIYIHENPSVTRYNLNTIPQFPVSWFLSHLVVVFFFVFF